LARAHAEEARRVGDDLGKAHRFLEVRNLVDRHFLEVVHQRVRAGGVALDQTGGPREIFHHQLSLRGLGHRRNRRRGDRLGDEIGCRADDPQRGVDLVRDAGHHLRHRAMPGRFRLVADQPFVLPPQTIHRQVRGDARQQLVRVERLPDVVDRPQLESAHDVAGSRLPREEDDRDVAPLRRRLDPRAGFEAVDVGHDDVQQDQIRTDLAQHLQRLPAGRGDADPIAPVAEDCRQRLNVRRRVFDDEDAAVARRRGHDGGSSSAAAARRSAVSASANAKVAIRCSKAE
jgi:hypothetical protein